MPDHLSTELLERYNERRLEPGQLLALDDHLADCASCRERLREMKPRRAALLALRESVQTSGEGEIDHPPGEDLMAYVYGRLNSVDRELVESHLEVCSPCSTRVQELRIPRSSPASQRWAKFVTALRMTSPFRLAGAVAAILVLAAGITMWLRNYTDHSETARLSDRSSLPPAPAPVLSLNDGAGQVTLDAEGNLGGLDSVLPIDQQRVKTALVTQKLELPRRLEGLTDSSSAMMGGGAETGFALVGPIGTFVASERPVFRWQALSGALSYQVTITEPAAGYKQVAVSPELKETEWRVDRALPRARIYTWQVTARTRNAEVKAPAAGAGEAKFSVLDQTTADEIARAEKAYAGRPLILGLIYAEAGLIDDADRELRALAEANPESTVAQNLWRNARARR